MNNKPEVVVITGASAGVGRATAREFARRGARIGLLARGREGLAGAARDVKELGGTPFVVPTDVADFSQVEAAATAIESEFGPIDIWVNNAMTSVFARFIEISPEDFRRVIEVTFLGCVHGTMAALMRMLPRDHGKIIQVGSALAYRAIPLQSAYCSAKHAMQGFTEAVRCELMHDKSRVKLTMVQLPAMNTPQFGWVKSKLPHKAQPVPPIYQPEVAARAIAWCADHYRREFIVGGSTLEVIWGNKFLPGLGDFYLAKTGFKSQQTSEPADPDQPNNLWEPVHGDHGAHGTFGNRAKSWSLQSWLNQHLGLTAMALAGGAALALATGMLARHEKHDGKRRQMSRTLRRRRDFSERDFAHAF